MKEENHGKSDYLNGNFPEQTVKLQLRERERMVVFFARLKVDLFA